MAAVSVKRSIVSGIVTGDAQVSYSWVARDFTKNQLPSRGITAPKHLYINKFWVGKGSSFCERGHLNF